MNFGEPFGGLMPGARGAVLAVLLRPGAPLTGRRIHSLMDGHSLGAVQQALRDLERFGVITTEPIGRAGVHRTNEHHEAAALRSLASPIEILTRCTTRVTLAKAAPLVRRAQSLVDLAQQIVRPGP